MSFLTFLSVTEKTWPLSRGYLGIRGHVLVGVAAVARFKQESVEWRFDWPTTSKTE